MSRREGAVPERDDGVCLTTLRDRRAGPVKGGVRRQAPSRLREPLKAVMEPAAATALAIDFRFFFPRPGALNFNINIVSIFVESFESMKSGRNHKAFEFLESHQSGTPSKWRADAQCADFGDDHPGISAITTHLS